MGVSEINKIKCDLKHYLNITINEMKHDFKHDFKHESIMCKVEFNIHGGKRSMPMPTIRQINTNRQRSCPPFPMPKKRHWANYPDSL